MYYLLFDTETTGFNRPSLELTDPAQPHCVQLSARMLDINAGKAIQKINLISRPEGWHIPQACTDVHGITNEHAARVGISEKVVACTLAEMFRRCDAFVCHNAEFDFRIADVMFARAGLPDRMGHRRSICTMVASKDIVRCPPTERMLRAGRRGFKSPKLIEAYVHFFGEGFEGAHNADADSDATERLFWHLREKGVIC